MSPAMLRSLGILQMPIAELRTALLREIEINPMLDLVDGGSGSDYVSSNYGASCDDYDLNSIAKEETLEEHILAQVPDISSEDKRILLSFLGRMDEFGFVSESDESLATELDVGSAKITKIRKLLGSLDPRGLGAKDLTECLLGQIKTDDVVLITLVSVHFKDLLANRYTKIERAMSIDSATLRSLLARLKELNFYPAKIFSESKLNVIMPDIILRKIYGEWQIDLNDRYLPKIKMSDSYKTMLACKNQLSRDDQKFFSHNSMSAKVIVSALNRRGDMLRKIAGILLEKQRDFFDGSSQVKPFLLKDLAELLAVHQSTIGRAIKDKYLQSPRGMFSLKYFFSKKSGGEGSKLSANGIMTMIRDIIADEKRDSPLSDVAIHNMLRNNGIVLTRRAVTKYRNALKILPAQCRKFL